jgi:hypothetical protein
MTISKDRSEEFASGVNSGIVASAEMKKFRRIKNYDEKEKDDEQQVRD